MASLIARPSQRAAAKAPLKVSPAPVVSTTGTVKPATVLVLGLCGVRGKVITFAGAVFVLGILGFSGSIYAMVLLGSKGLGLITPAGGLCFMLGWAALMWAGCRLGGKNE